VTGGGDGANCKRRHPHNFIVFQNFDAIGRHRRNPAPKSLHVVAEDAFGGVNQLCGIDEMFRTARVDINHCPKLGESPRCAGVIEVNVTKENMTNVFGREASISEIRDDVLESRFRAGVEQRDAVICFECGYGNDAGPAELARIEN